MPLCAPSTPARQHCGGGIWACISPSSATWPTRLFTWMGTSAKAQGEIGYDVGSPEIWDRQMTLRAVCLIPSRDMALSCEARIWIVGMFMSVHITKRNGICEKDGARSEEIAVTPVLLYYTRDVSLSLAPEGSLEPYCPSRRNNNDFYGQPYEFSFGLSIRSILGYIWDLMS